jgi:hypothetical protein
MEDTSLSVLEEISKDQPKCPFCHFHWCRCTETEKRENAMRLIALRTIRPRNPRQKN